MEIEIERCTPLDLEKILEIEEQSFDDPWREPSFRNELALMEDHSHCHFYKASIPSRGLVGYVVFQTVADELYIKKLAVHPGLRRCGIGSLLMRFTVDYAKKSHILKIVLDCDEDNIGALVFYQALRLRPVSFNRVTRKFVLCMDLMAMESGDSKTRRDQRWVASR